MCALTEATEGFLVGSGGGVATADEQAPWVPARILAPGPRAALPLPEVPPRAPGLRCSSLTCWEGELETDSSRRQSPCEADLNHIPTLLRKNSLEGTCSLDVAGSADVCVWLCVNVPVTEPALRPAGLARSAS